MPTMPEAPLRSRYDWVSYAPNLYEASQYSHPGDLHGYCAVVCDEWLSLAAISECAIHFIILLQRLGMRHVKPVRAIAERGGHLPICDLQSPGSNVAALNYFSRDNEFVAAWRSFFQPRCKHEPKREWRRLGMEKALIGRLYPAFLDNPFELG